MGDLMSEQSSGKKTAVRLNRWMLGFSRHWPRYFAVFLGIFAILPVLAPVLMTAGLEGPGRTIYSLYSPFCHQFGFRSFFIGGEQAVYPRGSISVGGSSWEDYADDINAYMSENHPDVVATFGPMSTDAYGFDRSLMEAARIFPGNDRMGYKTAVCERDVSIYFGLFISLLIFMPIRRRLRPVPLWLYVILGLGPIGIDGVSQLLSYPPFSMWEVRETYPLFRVLTGFLFGLMNGWLAYPYIEMSMRDTYLELRHKFERAGIPIDTK